MAVKYCVEFIINDIVKNQKSSCIAAIGPMRTIFNFSRAFYSLVAEPYKQGNSVIGVLEGFGQGSQAFYRQMHHELAYLVGL